MIRHHLTPEGYERVAAELQHCKMTLRPAIVRDIEEARAHGDLSENSEYDDAKERQALTEGRIAYLENVVAAAEVVDIRKVPQNGRVVFGCTVVVIDPDSGEERRYRVVGEQESNLDVGDISYLSPIGKALIGREEGEEAVVPTPQGPRRWEVGEVLYLDADGNTV